MYRDLLFLQNDVNYNAYFEVYHWFSESYVFLKTGTIVVACDKR